MIDTDKYEAAICGPMWAQQYGDVVKLVYPDWGGPSKKQQYIHGYKVTDALTAEQHLITDAPLLLAEVKRLRGLLDEIDDVVYYNDKKAGLVLPVEKPNLELLRDIMMSYTDEAYQIRGDEGEWIE